MANLENTFKGKRILITGGYGFLGTNLADALSAFDCEIVRLGRTCGIKLTGRKAKIVDLAGDVCDSATWEKVLKGVDIVFHLAAQTSDKVASENVNRDFDANVRPMLNLLEICRHKGFHPSVFFSGSITQVGVPSGLPFDEKHADSPITTYDLHKLIVENYLKFYIKKGIVRGAILRLAYVYGPGPKNSAADRGVLNQMIARAIQGKNLSVWGWGNYTRDYIFVGDVVRAFLMAAVNVLKINGGHFVIGTGNGHTMSEAFKIVATRVGEVTGKTVKVTHNNLRNFPEADRYDYIVDPKLFTRATGWKPNFSLVHGIEETIKHLTQQR